MKAEFTIGRVLRPRGIKGVVKIETYSENTARLLHLKTLNVGGTHYRMESASHEGAFLYAKLAGVDTPEDAETEPDGETETDSDGQDEDAEENRSEE